MNASPTGPAIVCAGIHSDTLARNGRNRCTLIPPQKAKGVLPDRALLANNFTADYSTPSSVLTVFDRATRVVKAVPLAAIAAFQIFLRPDAIIVTHYEFNANSGSDVSVVDYDLTLTCARESIPGMSANL